MMKRLMMGVAIAGLSACGIVPPVYLVDRHTVMELEASGDWPELEKRLYKQSLNMGPVSLASDPVAQRRERALRLLNGEYTTTETAAPPAGTAP